MCKMWPNITSETSVLQLSVYSKLLRPLIQAIQIGSHPSTSPEFCFPFFCLGWALLKEYLESRRFDPPHIYPIKDHRDPKCYLPSFNESFLKFSKTPKHCVRLSLEASHSAPLHLTLSPSLIIYSELQLLTFLSISVTLFLFLSVYVSI